MEQSVEEMDYVLNNNLMSKTSKCMNNQIFNFGLRMHSIFREIPVYLAFLTLGKKNEN